MERGRQVEQWNHTAALISHIRTSAGDKSATQSSKFHPYWEDDDTLTAAEYVARKKAEQSNGS